MKSYFAGKDETKIGCDTPTRLVNESNEFIGKKLRHAKRHLSGNKLRDSIDEESKISSARREEHRRKEELLRMFTGEKEVLSGREV